jgi:hypothetical protein
MRRIAGVYLVAGLCLVGSCADEGDSQEQTLEPTSEETDDGSTTTAKDKATTTTTTEPPAETDLNAVVLQLEEMPTGYAVDASADDETGDDDICGEDPTEDVPADEEAKVSFTAGDFGPFASSIVAQYSDEMTAAEFMDATTGAFENCREFTDPDDGTAYTFSGLAFPDLGDDTFAIRMTADSDFGSAAADLVYVRVGDRVMLTGNLAFGSVDSELTEEWSRLVAGRM